jgi:hypothetical protein
MTTAASSRRALAVAATEGACPRCGAARAADHRYCLSCGFALPSLTGRLPGLRRVWIRRFGWYPGDWVWAALPTLLVAAAATAGAIVVSDHRQHHARSFETVTAQVPVAAPSSPTQATTTGTPGTPTVDTSTLPKAPEPGAAGAGTNGRTVWPAGESGWTIVLVSYPKTFGHPEALATAAKAAKKGLQQVGVVDSSSYASLQPGYYVVFAGIYPSRAEADAAVGTARQAGFPGAYSREIAR